VSVGGSENPIGWREVSPVSHTASMIAVVSVPKVAVSILDCFEGWITGYSTAQESGIEPEDLSVSNFDPGKVRMFWIEKVIWFAGDNAGNFQGNVRSFLDPLISDFLGFALVTQARRNFGYSCKGARDLNLKEYKAFVEGFLAPGVYQSFEDTQCY
jgi:hypothetical protein